MLVRYRYRAYPTPGQAQLLARTFGCARVVFNDSLRTRKDAHEAGEKVSDAEVQRRVVTLAKATPEREWLGEVASVALVQACQDARRAYRNWFDSLSGKRRGRRVGHPRFRSRKDNRQSIRLTRNGFGVTAGGVRVAKVGDVRLVWSRALPSVPSSVTVIREADGRYYASFVVEVADHNQAIYVEDLAVSGLARTRLAKSVHDAGWSTLVRLLEEKAARCHRTVVKVGRWFPSSQLCSTCGFGSGKKPLEVRSWTCTECGVTHDRDVNAARNILAEGRKVAAGLAETINARGGDVRPGLVLAVACETRTHQGAA